MTMTEPDGRDGLSALGQRMDARLDALEQRMDAHAHALGQRLDAIRERLDHILAVLADAESGSGLSSEDLMR